MFRLTQKVCSNKFRRSSAVCNHHDFRRAGHHVDRHLAENQFFSGSHIGIAGTDDLFHRLDGFRTERQCRNTVHAAQTVNLRHTGKTHGIQHCRVRTGRGHRYDLFHPGCRGDACRVDHRGNQRSSTAGDIDTHPFHGAELFAQHHAAAGGVPVIPGLLLSGKRLNSFQSLLQRFAGGGGNLFAGGGNFFIRHPELIRGEFGFIKFQCIFRKCLIPAGPHIFKDFRHTAFDFRRVAGTLEQRLKRRIIAL